MKKKQYMLGIVFIISQIMTPISSAFAESIISNQSLQSETEPNYQDNKQDLQDELHIIEIPRIDTISPEKDETERPLQPKIEENELSVNEQPLEPAIILDEVLIEGYSYVKVENRQTFFEAVKVEQNIVLTADVELLPGDQVELFGDFRLLGRIDKSVKKNKLTLNTDSGTEEHRGLYALDATFGYGDVYVSDIVIENRDNGGIISFEDGIDGVQYYDSVEYTSNGGQAFVARDGQIHIKDSTFTQTSSL